MSDFSGNIARFTGFAAAYDEFRPAPPAVLAEILTTLARAPRPALVVDLGCGTGLSTRYWADKAERVIGIDPTESMRTQAETAPSPPISYRQGFSHETGLTDGCADIVTCSQALHWMDPLPTFREVARVLRPGGVFAAYDYDWPPATGFWEADAAFENCQRRVSELEERHGVSDGVRKWDKASHLARMRESGFFRQVREVLAHHHEPGNADRFLGALGSQGGLRSLTKIGLTEAEIGISEVREVAERLLGEEPRLWHWSYRIRVGIV
jgi:SAM-dependent methyltransferase